MTLDERRSSVAPSRLFAVGQQQDHVVAKRRAVLQGPGGLQHYGYTRGVVGRAGGGRHGVVVGHQHHRTTGIGTRDSRRYIDARYRAVGNPKKVRSFKLL